MAEPGFSLRSEVCALSTSHRLQFSTDILFFGGLRRTKNWKTRKRRNQFQWIWGWQGQLITCAQGAFLSPTLEHPAPWIPALGQPILPTNQGTWSSPGVPLTRPSAPQGVSGCLPAFQTKHSLLPAPPAPLGPSVLGESQQDK